MPRLTIPAGSVKGEKHCTEVVIIDDYLKEDRESFSVEATVLSPTTVNVGSCTVQSSTGSVEVIIIDDDGTYSSTLLYFIYVYINVLSSLYLHTCRASYPGRGVQEQV